VPQDEKGLAVVT